MDCVVASFTLCWSPEVRNRLTSHSAGACRKFLALTAGQVWSSTLSPPVHPCSLRADVRRIVEDPSRFSHLERWVRSGLTPRRYQSGETDRSGQISRCGDGLARTLMYEAATDLYRVKRPLHRKRDAVRILRELRAFRDKRALGIR